MEWVNNPSGSISRKGLIKVDSRLAKFKLEEGLVHEVDGDVEVAIAYRSLDTSVA